MRIVPNRLWLRAWLACGLAAACSAPRTSPGPPLPEGRLAVLFEDRLVLWSETGLKPVPGLERIDTFCWDAAGTGFYLSRGGTLSWLGLSGERRNLVSGFGALRFPDASPDGRRVAFAATEGDPRSTEWSVWTCGVDGAGLRRIAPGYDPSWSPDSRLLYFETFKDGIRLERFDLTTGQGRAFPAPRAGEIRDYTVEVSPRGRYVAFSRDSALYLWEAASGSLRNLTGAKGYCRFPSFSPGESHLVFYRSVTTEDGGTREEIVRRHLATGEETVLLREPGVVLAAYSPAPPAQEQR